MRPGDYSESDLLAKLRTWWGGEVGGGPDDPFATPEPASGTIFDIMPAIDSLGVVNGLITIEKHVGFELPPSIIRRGGYGSFEEMTSDLLPKVRAMAERRKRSTQVKEAA